MKKRLTFKKFEKKNWRWNYKIINSIGEQLGIIGWSDLWKKYVFSAESDNYIFDTSCLNEIINFMKSIKK